MRDCARARRAEPGGNQNSGPSQGETKKSGRGQAAHPLVEKVLDADVKGVEDEGGKVVVLIGPAAIAPPGVYRGGKKKKEARSV